MTGLNQDLALPCLVEVAEIISCLLVEVAEERVEEDEWLRGEGDSGRFDNVGTLF